MAKRYELEGEPAMANKPGTEPKVMKRPRVDDATYDFVDNVMLSIPVLLRDDRFPMVQMERLEFRPGEKGVSITYQAKGQTHYRFVSTEEMVHLAKTRAEEQEAAGKPDVIATEPMRQGAPDEPYGEDDDHAVRAAAMYGVPLNEVTYTQRTEAKRMFFDPSYVPLLTPAKLMPPEESN